MLFIDALDHSPTFFFILLTGTGFIVGSFINVVIYRLPIMLENQWRQESQAFLDTQTSPPPTTPFNLSTPSSRCPFCQHKIGVFENVPVLSYLFLKGRCSSCKAKISSRYPIIECFSATMTALIGWKFGITVETIAYCVLAWCLLTLAMIDYDTQLLPDSITLPLIWLGLIFNSFNTSVPLSDAVWGAVAGYMSLWTVYWAFKIVTGKEGMGYGDFKLLAALGAWLGWATLPLIIFLSSLVGTIVAISLIALKMHKRTQPIPFGPFLSSAGFVALLWSDNLLYFYFSVIGV